MIELRSGRYWVSKIKKHLLRNTVIDLLLRIEKGGYSHLLIHQAIQSRQLCEKDERLLTEIVYGTIQRKLTLDYYIRHFVKRHKKKQPWVTMLLRMSIYQMVYLDRVPDHAIIHEAVEIAKQRGHKGIASFVNGVLRNIQRKGLPSIQSIEDPIKRLSVETSHPEWLVKRWTSLYGYEKTKEMCVANLERHIISVRVHPLKISREEAIDHLTDKGFRAKPSQFSNQGIIIEQGNVLTSTLFKEGLVSIQDESSMLVGEMLDVSPGMTVLDACSAPGGKSTHIAEKMSDQGLIYAYDLHAKKTKLVEKKANQLDLSIIKTRQLDARKLQTIHEAQSFDRILVDAPCTGFGVIRAKPDIKYRKRETDIYNLATVQLQILTSVAPLLKRGGLLVYSTCTVDREENEKVIEKFLEGHKNYAVDPHFFASLPAEMRQSPGVSKFGLQLFPQTFQTDGFFLTRLIKKS